MVSYKDCIIKAAQMGLKRIEKLWFNSDSTNQQSFL